MVKSIYLNVLTATSFLAIVGCVNTDAEALLNPIDLELKEHFLPLDSVTTSNNEFYQVLETDSGTYFTFLNPLVLAIYTYDLDKRELVKTIPLEKDGPNGLGEKVMSYQIISKDSIILHSYYKRSLILINEHGQVLKKYPLYTDSIDHFPRTGDGAGIQKIGHQLFLNSGMGCSTEEPENFSTQIAIDLNDSTITEILPLSSSYRAKKNNFWPRKYCDLFSTYTDSLKGLVYSFAGDESIYYYDTNDTLTSVPFGKGKLGNQRPIPFGKFPKDAMSEFVTFLSYNRFGRIHYDRYRQLLIRSFHNRTPNELIEENILRTESALIVANEKMEVLGEAQLSGDHELFFTQEGLHQVLFNSNREDSLEIRLYEYNF